MKLSRSSVESRIVKCNMLFVMRYCFLVNYSNNQRCGCCRRCCLAWWWIPTAWCAHHIDLVDTNKEQYTGINVNKMVEEIHSKVKPLIYFTAFVFPLVLYIAQTTTSTTWTVTWAHWRSWSHFKSNCCQNDVGRKQNKRNKEKCHQKCVEKRKQAGFWVIGFERLQMSKDRGDSLFKKVQRHYCHVVTDMLSTLSCTLFLYRTVTMAFWSFSLSLHAINPSCTSFHSINSYRTH